MACRLSKVTGRHVSRVGFGAARLGEILVPTNDAQRKGSLDQGDNPEAEAALVHALGRGVNVIDTATVYGRDGASEKAVGRVLDAAGALGEVSVISKFGYRLLEPASESDPPVQKSSSATVGYSNVSPDLNVGKLPPCSVPVSPGVVSCFDPDFIRSELTNSLSRLRADAIDAYLLHDPERYLEHHLPLKADTELDDASVEKRVETFMSEVIMPSFVVLEEEVKKGRILSYGVSSKSFCVPKMHPHHISIEALLSTAAKAYARVNGNSHASKDSSMSTIQLPLNPFETGGLAFAKDARDSGHGLHVMTVRPLSAVDKQGVWKIVDDEKLATPRTPTSSSPDEEVVYQLPAVEKMRDARNAVFAHFDPPPPNDPNNPTEDELEIAEACAFLCALARDMDAEIGQFTSFQHYEQNIVEGILPMLDGRIDQMDEVSVEVLQSFFEAYSRAVRAVVPLKTRQRLQSVLDPLSSIDNSSFSRDNVDGLSLHRTRTHSLGHDVALQDYALEWVGRVPCIDSTIVGMTNIEHVDKALEKLQG